MGKERDTSFLVKTQVPRAEQTLQDFCYLDPSQELSVPTVTSSHTFMSLVPDFSSISLPEWHP